MTSHFPESYESSRTRFKADAKRISALWPSSRLESHPLRKFPDLSIDWLWAEPQHKEKLVVISTGQHGIEGYAGSAMLKVFMDEFAPRFNTENTGLLLIHAINPWGMKHRLRVNPNHVDLNRNFILNADYDPLLNPDFKQLTHFLNPRRPARQLVAERLPFLFQVLKLMLFPGRKHVQRASLLGQHCDPTGIYFGGTETEEESLVLMDLYRSALHDYQTFLQVDQHTGYGPRYQMTMLLSTLDAISSLEAMQKYHHPLIQKMDADEFYMISGDMGDYIYHLRNSEFPVRTVLAACFEFGTYGDSLPALIHSLHTTILENQLRHHGAVDSKAARQIRAEYEKLFLPDENKWREKAINDCRLAFEGIFSAHQLLG